MDNICPELDRLEEEFNTLAEELVDQERARSYEGSSEHHEAEGEAHTENLELSRRERSGNKTTKLIELASHLLERCRDMTEERLENLSEKEDFKSLANENLLLKEKLESTKNILSRKEEDIGKLHEEMEDLESKNIQLNQEYKDSIKEVESNSDYGTPPEGGIGGYKITLSETPTKRINDPAHFRTFTPRNDSLHVENFKMSKSVKDLIRVTSEIISQFKDQAGRIEGQESVINRIDKEIEHILKGQKVDRQSITGLQTCLDEVGNDFEDHWKLIQQVIKDNQTLGDEVTRIKKVEIPAVKNYMLQRSQALTNNLGVSNTLNPPLGASTVLQGQIQGHLQTSNSTTPNADYQKQDSNNFRVDGSLCSNDFNFAAADNDSDHGVYIKNSVINDLEDINDGVSGRSDDVSDTLSRPRKSYIGEKDEDNESQDSWESERLMEKGHQIRRTLADQADKKEYSHSFFNKRGSNFGTTNPNKHLDTILEQSKSMKGSKRKQTKSSQMLDEVEKDKVRASTHLRQNSAIMRDQNTPNMVRLNTDSSHINGERFSGLIIDSYNHNLKRSYMVNIIANKAFQGNRFPGYQIQKDVGMVSPIPFSDSTNPTDMKGKHVHHLSYQSFDNPDFCHNNSHLESVVTQNQYKYSCTHEELSSSTRQFKVHKADSDKKHCCGCQDGKPYHIQTDNGTRKESHSSDLNSIRSRKKTQDFDDNDEPSYKLRKSKKVKFGSPDSKPTRGEEARKEENAKNTGNCCVIF